MVPVRLVNCRASLNRLLILRTPEEQSFKTLTVKPIAFKENIHTNFICTIAIQRLLMYLNAHIGIPFVQTTKQMFGTAFMVISGLVMGKCFLVLFLFV